eukprot:g18604.t1
MASRTGKTAWKYASDKGHEDVALLIDACVQQYGDKHGVTKETFEAKESHERIQCYEKAERTEYRQRFHEGGFGGGGGGRRPRAAGVENIKIHHHLGGENEHAVDLDEAEDEEEDRKRFPDLAFGEDLHDKENNVDAPSGTTKDKIPLHRPFRGLSEEEKARAAAVERITFSPEYVDADEDEDENGFPRLREDLLAKFTKLTGEKQQKGDQDLRQRPVTGEDPGASRAYIGGHSFWWEKRPEIAKQFLRNKKS